MAEQQKQGPRTIEIYGSVNRPNLLLGCEREPLLALGLTCALLIMGVLSWWALIIGIGAWIVGLYFLRQMAKADPIMLRVYARHRRYRGFYSAQPRWQGASRESNTKWIK